MRDGAGENGPVGDERVELAVLAARVDVGGQIGEQGDGQGARK